MKSLALAAILLLATAAAPDAADWQELVPASGYWIDAAHIEASGETRSFRLRYAGANGASVEFQDSADCRANTTDVRKFEVQDGERLVMLFIDPAVEREVIALACTVAG